MNRFLSIAFALIVILFVGVPVCYVEAQAARRPRQILWNRDNIDALLNNPQFSRSSAYCSLVDRAETYCVEEPLTVVHKPMVPPSGILNDYMSLSTYAWPDTTKPDGMPYIVRDGYSNPDADNYDFPALVEMSTRVQTLVLSWYLTKNEKYAKKALEQVRVWFINKKTRMNPHLNYSQVVPGRNNGNGYEYGVIDGYYFVEMIDALLLLEGYSGFHLRDRMKVRKWFSNYLQWLTTSELGLEEEKADNNHGTSYDGQVLAFSIYTSNQKLANKIIGGFSENRIKKQIRPDGAQPLELKRTRSFCYSVMNIDRMMDFLLMTKFYGHEIDDEGLDLFCKSVEFMLPYINEDSGKWPYKQVISYSYDKRLLSMDYYIIAKYLSPKRIPFMEVLRPNDERSKRSVERIIY